MAIMEVGIINSIMVIKHIIHAAREEHATENAIVILILTGMAQRCAPAAIMPV